MPGRREAPRNDGAGIFNTCWTAYSAWRALRESNPCFRRERAASWTARRRARAAWKTPGRIESFGAGGKLGQTFESELADRSLRPSPRKSGARERAQRSKRPRHHLPVFFIEDHGSFGGRAAPFCNSSIECLSGERTNAMVPSRGGRLMVTPAFCSRSHSA